MHAVQRIYIGTINIQITDEMFHSVYHQSPPPLPLVSVFQLLKLHSAINVNNNLIYKLDSNDIINRLTQSSFMHTRRKLYTPLVVDCMV